MALSKIENNNQTNRTWRDAVDAGIDLLNSDILQANTSITVTQSDSTDESTTVCEVAGHTSATFDSSNSGSSTAQGIIQAAIDSIPKNMSGHSLNIYFGTTGGQTITISAQINIISFRGGAVAIQSAKESDNDDDSSTKANTIQSAGTSLNRIFAIYDCSECFISGLNIIQDTGATGDDNQFVIVCSSTWVDIHHCVIKCGGTTDDKYMAVLIQRGSRAFVRDSYVGNAWVGVRTANMGIVSIASSYSIEPKPRYGCQATNGIILQAGVQISGSVGDKFVSAGGIIVPSDGIVIDETILSDYKYVNISAGTSGDDIRTLIRKQPRNLGGYGITFRFEAAAAGSQNTYDLGSAYADLNGFVGGNIVFQSYDFTANADVDESGTGSGTYRTKIIGSSSNYNGIVRVSDCSDVFFNDLAFEVTGTNANAEGIVSRNSTIWVARCQFKGIENATTDTYSKGVRVQRGFGNILNSYFSDFFTAIVCTEAASLFLNSNNDYGNTNVQGQVAQQGSKISLSGSRVNGTTDLITATGGLIVPANGIILTDQSGGSFGTTAEAVYGQTEL